MLQGYVKKSIRRIPRTEKKNRGSKEIDLKKILTTN